MESRRSASRFDGGERDDGASAKTGQTSVNEAVQLGTPSVFILDEEVRADLFELWLAAGCRVHVANDLSSIREAFDESITVALVRNEASDELKDEVQRQITAKAPFCRTVVTTTEHVEIMFPGVDYDVCLTEPTTKQGVRETVSRLTRRAQYQRTLKEYYRYAFRAANLEVQHETDALLRETDYTTANEAVEHLKQRLDALLETFDADDLNAVQQSIRPESRFGPETSRQNKQSGEKHRPDSCVGCGLEWGVDYGGSMNQGYRRLGAFAWKCTDCGTVQNLPDPSHRRLARR